MSRARLLPPPFPTHGLGINNTLILSPITPLPKDLRHTSTRLRKTKHRLIYPRQVREFGHGVESSPLVCRKLDFKRASEREREREIEITCTKAYVNCGC